MKKILLLFIMSSIIFAGCDNNEVNIKSDIVKKPTEEDFRQAIKKLKENELAGFTFTEDDQFNNARSTPSGLFIALNRYLGFGAFLLYGQCIIPHEPSSKLVKYIDYWAYNYEDDRWTFLQSYNSNYADDEEMSYVSAGYQNNLNADCWVVLVAHVYYRLDGVLKLNFLEYSNDTFLDWPYH